MSVVSNVQSKKGMPYGGMGSGAILDKLEVTDPRYLPRGPSTYDRYATGEILDRTPDAPVWAEDAPRYNGTRVSGAALNLRYGGTRGSNPDGPRHPEMFFGFLGNDPRGADTQVRFDRMRAQSESRARQATVRMGHNVGQGGGPNGEASYQESEHPYTGLEFERDRPTRLVQSRRRAKIFTVQKDNYAAGANSFVLNPEARVRERRSAIEAGHESMYIPTQDQPFQNRYFDRQALVDPECSDTRSRVDPSAGQTWRWREITCDTKLKAARYGRSGGMALWFGEPGAAGAGQREQQQKGRSAEGFAANAGIGAPDDRAQALHKTRGEQQTGVSRTARATNAQSLARFMARDADSRRAQDARGRQESNFGRTAEGGAAPHSRTTADVAAALRSTRQTQQVSALTLAESVARGDGVPSGDLRHAQGGGRATALMGAGLTAHQYSTSTAPAQNGTVLGAQTRGQRWVPATAEHATAPLASKQPEFLGQTQAAQNVRDERATGLGTLTVSTGAAFLGEKSRVRADRGNAEPLPIDEDGFIDSL